MTRVRLNTRARVALARGNKQADKFICWEKLYMYIDRERKHEFVSKDEKE